MKEYFVSVVKMDCTQGPMYGPFDAEEAEHVLLGILAQNRVERSGRMFFGPLEITDAIREQVHQNGSYSHVDGGGVFIVSPIENFVSE